MGCALGSGSAPDSAKGRTRGTAPTSTRSDGEASLAAHPAAEPLRTKISPHIRGQSRFKKDFWAKQSLIGVTVMYYPACDMLASWVVVRPMDDAAFLVPHVLAIETNAVA